MDAFIELIQTALGVRDSVSVLPQTREEWEALYSKAAKHNMLGLTFPVIDEIHDTVDIPLGVYSRWAMVTEKIQKKNAALVKACRQLSDMFLENGFRVCIMKGQAVAALYPRPELRHCGDIDLWVGGGREKVMDFLRPRFPMRKVLYIHADVQMLKGIGTEVHFTPSWLNSPIGDRRLQKYFKSREEEQFGHFDRNLGFCTLTLEFDLVYMLQHIYRHVLEAGIGLRQLLDYYYVLKSASEEDMTRARQDLNHLRMMNFAAGVMYVLQEVFLLDKQHMIADPDPVLGAFLLDEIMRSGNFGRYDSRNADPKTASQATHIKSKVTRALRFLKYFPSEVLWMPWFMTWQYFWRRRRGYLYKGR